MVSMAALFFLPTLHKSPGVSNVFMHTNVSIIKQKVGANDLKIDMSLFVAEMEFKSLLKKSVFSVI